MIGTKRLSRFSIWPVIAFSCVAPAFADGDFRLMPGTTSPDGAYALSYGVHNPAVAHLAKLNEAAADDSGFDQAIRAEFAKVQTNMPEGIVNYLVDLKTRQPVMILPDWHSCPGNNYPPLEIGWRSDHRQAVIINSTRFSWNSVLWIDVRSRQATPVGKMLETEFRRFLAGHEGKRYTTQADRIGMMFTEPSVPRSGTLVLGMAEAYVPKSTVDGFSYRLTFKNVHRSGRPRFALVSAHRTD